MMYNFTDENGVQYFIDPDEIVIAVKEPQDTSVYVVLRNGQEKEVHLILGDFILQYLKSKSIKVLTHAPNTTTPTDSNVQQVRTVQHREAEKEHSQEGNAHA